MKTLVTGATGFIGRHLVAALIDRGDDIRCLVRQRSHELDNLEVEQIIGDITCPESLEGIADSVDRVFHLASIGHAGVKSVPDMERFREVNITGLENLISEIVRTGTIRKFVHFSSTAAIGLMDGIANDEDAGNNPNGLCRNVKREAEKIVLSHAYKSKLPAVIVRPSTVYGPGCRNAELISLCRIVKKGFYPVPDRINVLIPFVYVTDVVKGAMLAEEHGKTGGTYTLASEYSYPLCSLAKQIALELRRMRKETSASIYAMNVIAAITEKVQMLGRKKPPAIERKSVESVYTDRAFDTAKAKEELGYKPEVEFEEGIAKTIAWFIEYKMI